MTADVIEEAVPSLFMRSGAHKDAPTSNPGAVGEWKACNGVSMTADATEEVVPSLLIRLGAHRDAPTSSSGAEFIFWMGFPTSPLRTVWQLFRKG
jgi:hypothetical protein